MAAEAPERGPRSTARPRGRARRAETGAAARLVGDSLHSSVYRELSHRLITGRITPGSALSTRGIAQEMGLSQMPVREALSRLAAEGAVQIRSKRRIVVPLMTAERFQDLLRCRVLLEPEAAAAALPFIDGATLKRLVAVDDAIGEALKSGDVNAYMEGNFRFHFLIYNAQPRRTLNRLIETLWLQFGPFMRVVYGKFGTARLVDQHQRAIRAIRARDAKGLARAILADIRDGMGLIGKAGFEPE